MRFVSNNMGDLWMQLLRNLYYVGKPVHPRPGSSAGPTRETLAVSLNLTQPLNNIIVNDMRKLSYRFMVAEWLWIMFGHDDVKTIVQYAKHIADFSDDGKTFNGSYGVPVKQQWPYILGVLRKDLDSRQAILQIYRTPTGPTKDVPCTLSLQFIVRDRHLHTIANMRSSDVWLGLPYDVFNFTMIGNVLAGQLGVDIGYFTIHLGSSHMYERNAEDIKKILEFNAVPKTVASPQLPGFPPDELEQILMHRNMQDLGDPWFKYAYVLTSTNNAQALEHLEVM